MKKLIISVLALILILTGCAEGKYPHADGENTILLLDRFGHKFFSYNMDKYNVEEKCEKNSFVQYEFPTQCEYYTSGDGTTLDFSIIKIENNEVKELLKIDNGKYILPLSATDDDLFFCLGADTEDDFNKVLVKYDKGNNELIEYSKVSGRINRGTIIGNKLFYNVLEQTDEKRKYSLYSVKFDDIEAEPILEKQDLKCDDIYSQGDRLYFSDEKYIYSDDGKKFLKASQNYFVGENLLVQYCIDDNKDMAMKVTNTETNEIVFTSSQILGFEVKENKIIAYCYGKIETFDF